MISATELKEKKLALELSSQHQDDFELAEQIEKDRRNKQNNAMFLVLYGVTDIVPEYVHFGSPIFTTFNEEVENDKDLISLIIRAKGEFITIMNDAANSRKGEISLRYGMVNSNHFTPIFMGLSPSVEHWHQLKDLHEKNCDILQEAYEKNSNGNIVNHPLFFPTAGLALWLKENPLQVFEDYADYLEKDIAAYHVRKKEQELKAELDKQTEQARLIQAQAAKLDMAVLDKARREAIKAERIANAENPDYA